MERSEVHGQSAVLCKSVGPLRFSTCILYCTMPSKCNNIAACEPWLTWQTPCLRVPDTESFHRVGVPTKNFRPP